MTYRLGLIDGGSVFLALKEKRKSTLRNAGPRSSGRLSAASKRSRKVSGDDPPERLAHTGRVGGTSGRSQFLLRPRPSSRIRFGRISGGPRVSGSVPSAEKRRPKFASLRIATVLFFLAAPFFGPKSAPAPRRASIAKSTPILGFYNFTERKQYARLHFKTHYYSKNYG